MIGTVRAAHLRDIAWVDTLREAAKYQPIRRMRREDQTPGNSQVILTGADLRSYRRASEPGHMLVLVLDHTCRRSGDWLIALAPHLRRAYLHRAAVGVVEVGGGTVSGIGASTLRAERRVMRSLLHPFVVTALRRPPGGATPLAHGFHLAFETLRHALQHGHAPVSAASLVVVTDGLGNVPLAASRTGEAPEMVTDEGVHDAIDVARKIAELRRVEPVLIAAPGSPYPWLPEELATALGPKCQLVLPDGSWRV